MTCRENIRKLSSISKSNFCGILKPVELFLGNLAAGLLERITTNGFKFTIQLLLISQANSCFADLDAKVHKSMRGIMQSSIIYIREGSRSSKRGREKAAEFLA